MSMLGILLAILGFIISPFGFLSIMVGLTLFIILPVMCKPFNVKQPVRFYTYLATMPINRASLVVSDHNDIVFKQMAFDAIGVEKITLDGEEKDFEDPDKALHYWKNIPFALADEVHGVLFDPRHAAIGRKKHEAKKRDEGMFLPTEEEWDQFSIQKWMKGVFEMPTDHELVDLSHVRELADGGERAEYGNRTEEFYKNSQSPFGTDAKIAKFLYPAIGFMIPFCGIWILSSQLGAPTGGSTVSFGSGIGGALLLMPTRLSKGWKWLKSKLGGLKSRLSFRSSSDDEPEEPDPSDDSGSSLPSLRTVAASLFWLLVIGGIEYGLYTLFGLTITVAVNLAVLLGFSFLPVLGILSKPVTILSGMFSKLFFRLAFMGFREPVFYWTPKKYILKEFADIEKVGDTKWYNLFGTQVAFSYPPEPSSWDAEVMDHSELEAMPIPEDKPGTSTDGGKEIKTNIPKKYARTEQMNRDRYGAFIPKRITENNYYLHTARALERFKHSANGEKSHLRLQEAKEKHGGGDDGMDDNSVLYLTAAMSFIGVVLGIWFFLL